MVSGTSKGKGIFNHEEEFFKKNNLEWSNFDGCKTNGALAILGRISLLRKSCFARDKL